MSDRVSTSQPEQLRERTKQFALRIVTLFQALPKSDVARTLGRQILRSGTSVAANYRAVCRARSKAEFIAKVGVVLEEADETVFWLELLIERQKRFRSPGWRRSWLRRASLCAFSPLQEKQPKSAR